MLVEIPLRLKTTLNPTLQVAMPNDGHWFSFVSFFYIPIPSYCIANPKPS